MVTNSLTNASKGFSGPPDRVDSDGLRSLRFSQIFHRFELGSLSTFFKIGPEIQKSPSPGDPWEWADMAPTVANPAFGPAQCNTTLPNKINRTLSHKGSPGSLLQLALSNAEDGF